MTPATMKKTFERLREERGFSVDEVEEGANLPHGSLIGIETGKHQSAHGLYCLAKFFQIELDKSILTEYGVIINKK